MNDSRVPSSQDNLRRLIVVACLVLPFSLIELTAGLISGSLTLVADSVHMGFDFIALSLSITAILVSRLNHSAAYSFGYHRAQILAAFVNGLLMLIVAIWIAVEAMERLASPRQILYGPVLFVGVIGLLINAIGFTVLSHSQNLNVRAAALHVLGDLLGSIAVIASAVLIWHFEWPYVDPILSMFIALILVRGAVKVLKESGHILLEGTPHQLDVVQVREALKNRVQGVHDVHHIHIWSLTDDRRMVTLHIETSQDAMTEHVLRDAKEVLERMFDVTHSTIQIELESCPDAPSDECESRTTDYKSNRALS